MTDKTTSRALIWSGIERLGFQAISLVVQIILARILLPKDFGLVGMLAIFIAISQSIIDGGFGAALIQKKITTERHFSTIFYFNIILAIFCYILLFVGAPYISDFYREVRLVELTRVIGLNLIINSFGQVQNTMLVKSLEFKTISKIRIVSVFLSGILGVFLAFNGFGVWSIVIFTLSGNIIKTVLLWTYNSWRPKIIFHMKALRDLFTYGSRLFLSGIIAVIFENIYLLVIGRFFSANQLGFYSQAKTFQSVPVLTLSLIIENVIFPKFSRIQDDIVALKKGFSKALNLQVFLNFPLMLGGIVLAKPLILLLLTDKWEASVFYMQILCVGGLFYPISATNLNVFKVVGRSDLYLKLTLWGRGLTVLSIIFGLYWGIFGLIVGRVIVSGINSIIITVSAGRLIQYGLFEQLKDMLPVFLSAVIMAASMFMLGSLNHYSLFSKLIVQILAGMIIYYGMNNMLKTPSFIEGRLKLKEMMIGR